MIRVTLSEPDAFDQFRDAARGLIAAGATPGQVIWQAGDSTDLFGDAQRPTHETPHFSVAAGFIELAGDVICHRDPERFALLYALLWRLTHNEKSLLLVAADPLVHRLRLMQKSVRRDTHKMTAFVAYAASTMTRANVTSPGSNPSTTSCGAFRRFSSIASPPCAGRS
jgi:uracil-DNA glycosylase